MKDYKVYCIYCPETRKPKYVGSTNNLDARIAQHMSSPHSEAIHNFMHGLKAKNKKPVVKILDSFILNVQASEFEKSTIEKMCADGEDLLNHRHNASKRKLNDLYLTDFED